MRSNVRATLLVMLAAATLAGQATRAQIAQTPALDAQAKAVLDVASNALGMLRGAQRVDAVAQIEFWATGNQYAVGQAYTPDGAWPAFKITAYHASLNYNAPGMRVDFTRTNPDGRVQGGGGLPVAAPQRQINVVSGQYAWNETQPGGGLVAGQGAANPALAAASDRLLQLWITPHGVVKAARAAGTQTKVGNEAGKTTITFPVSGTTVKATLNAANLIEKVEYTSDDPVLGDVVTETLYSDYGDWNDADLPPARRALSDVQFPRHIVQRQGGFPILDLTITKTDTNNPYVVMPVPASVETAAAVPPPAAPPQKTVTTTKVADGVYYLTGPSHHSVLVEFNDYVALVECPLNDERALAVLDAVKKAVPNKPLRYVIATHHHFDHSGGLRACASTGATVLVQGAATKAYFEKVWAQPHTLVPDVYAKANRKPVIEAIADKRVLSDSANTLELYKIANDHADTMLLGYLPKQKVLIEVDLWNPPAANAPNPPPGRDIQVLMNQIQQLKLDVQQITPMHGRLVTMAELRAAAGRPATN